jgi:hypothetical protein
MGEQLRVGDRVRVTDANRPDGFQVGEMGRVVWVGPAHDEETILLCEMDRTGPGRLAAFYPNEIEPAP